MKFKLFKKTSFQKKQIINSIIIGTALSVFVVFIYVALYESVSGFENIFQNYFFQKRCDRGPIFHKYLDKIIVVEIDEASLKEFGTWPIKRSLYAEFLKKIKSAGPKIVGFDIFFPEVSGNPKEDIIFANEAGAFKELLIGVQTVIEEEETGGEIKHGVSIQKPYKALWKAMGEDYKNIGLVSYPEDKDGITRLVPLYQLIENKIFLNFDMKILAEFLDIPIQEIKLEKNKIKLKDKIIPLTDYNRLRINYGFKAYSTEGYKRTGNVEALASQCLTLIPFKDILSAKKEDLENTIKNNIVLLGLTATAGHDIKFTPLGRMPGVFIHANIILSILEDKFLYEFKRLYWIAWMLTLGILLGFISTRFTPKTAGGISFALILGAFILSYELFMKKSIIFPVLPSIANIVMCYSFITLYHYQTEQRTKKKLSGLFKEFAPLPSSMLEEILSTNKTGAEFGGKKANLTILFSDIRGYTDLSEKLDPVTVMNTLNEYHHAMGEIFESNGAVIFDYQGDAQMVVLGLTETSRKNHALAACKTGLEMQEKMDELRDKWEKEGKHIFEVGVGICTGDVSLGVVGSVHRKQYAAIGDSTNVAARLQGMSKTLNAPVLISESTYIAAGEKIKAEKLEPVRLKGKSELLQVYKVTGLNRT